MPKNVRYSLIALEDGRFYAYDRVRPNMLLLELLSCPYIQQQHLEIRLVSPFVQRLREEGLERELRPLDDRR